MAVAGDTEGLKELDRRARPPRTPQGSRPSSALATSKPPEEDEALDPEDEQKALEEAERSEFYYSSASCLHSHRHEGKKWTQVELKESRSFLGM